MLEAFHEGVDLTGFEILEIERPLSARLYTDEGQPTDLKLIGVLDLVLKDEAGRIIAVDNKTAAKPYAQATVDDDNQLTCYAYLLAANRYVFPTAEVHCRLDVLRKLKTPKMEHYHTVRTAGSAPPVRQARLRPFLPVSKTRCSSPSPPGCVRIAPTRMPVGRGEFHEPSPFLSPVPESEVEPISARNRDADRYQMLTQEMMFSLKTRLMGEKSKPVSVKCQLSATAFFR